MDLECPDNYKFRKPRGIREMIRLLAKIGLTSFDPESSDTIDYMLARADLALYQARRAGRNQTAAFNPEIKQVATA